MTNLGRRDVIHGGAAIAALSLVPPVAGESPTVVDETGKKKVTVVVGAEGNGGTYAFGPAAVRIDPGTTVVWQWSGNGGMHNVIAENGSFESDLQEKAGATFEHTFEADGINRYYCEPHRAMGMKGIVLVGNTALPGATDKNEATEPAYGGWFDGVDNFDKTVDMTDRDDVTIEVGAQANGGPYGFEPAAIRIDPDTTVTWRWSGNGIHDVVAEDGSFVSDLSGDADATFTYTFRKGGVEKYVCEAHRGVGMKGAVVVNEPKDVAANISSSELALGGSFVAALLSPLAFALFLAFRRSPDTPAENTVTGSSHQ